MTRHIDNAVRHIIDHRADKSWTPFLAASETTAQALGGRAAGLQITVAEMAHGLVEIRSVEAVTVGDEALPAGSTMARFSVKFPAKEE